MPRSHRSSRVPSAAADYLAGLGPGSRRTMEQSLQSIAALLSSDPRATAENFPWQKITAEESTWLRRTLASRHRPATANKMLSALRGVLRKTRDLGLMSEPAFQAAAALPQVAQEASDDSQLLTPAEIRRLFVATASDPTAAGRRDAALLAILLSTGLRRAEAAALDASDCSGGRLHIRSAEPHKDRFVELPAPARAALTDWLAVRGDKPGPLLLAVLRNGVIRCGRLTDQAIYEILRRLAARANLPGVTSRELRRAYVVGLIARGLPPERVQALAGHASWVTTDAYKALAKAAGRGAKRLGRIPYTRPKPLKKGRPS